MRRSRRRFRAWQLTRLPWASFVLAASPDLANPSPGPRFVCSDLNGDDPIALGIMPTYLCHGFRWHRRSIRVFVVVQNIDDAAPEWVIATHSSPAILESFYSLFDFLPQMPEGPSKSKAQPSRKKEKLPALPAAADEFALPPPTVPPEEDDVLQNSWSAVKLLEEYDPQDLGSVSRPYAYVADYAVRIDLSASVVEEIARYEERMARESADARPMLGGTSDEYGRGSGLRKGSSSKRMGWFEKLRDQLQKGEDIRWYIVVCGDEERAAPEEIDRSSSREPSRQRSASRGTAGADYRTRSSSASRSLSNRQRGRSASASARETRPIPSLPRKDNPAGASQQQVRPYGTPPVSQGHFSSPSRDYGTPTLRPKPSVDMGGPKTPKSGGLRRLFGRRNEDASP